MEQKLRTYHTIAIFHTLNNGIVHCPIEFIGTRIFSDKEFEEYGNKKLDSIERILDTKKQITMVDTSGITQTLYDRDIFKITVGTVELVHNPNSKTAKPMIIQFNPEVL